jgi:hypothetical protein
MNWLFFFSTFVKNFCDLVSSFFVTLYNFYLSLFFSPGVLLICEWIYVTFFTYLLIFVGVAKHLFLCFLFLIFFCAL